MITRVKDILKEINDGFILIIYDDWQTKKMKVELRKGNLQISIEKSLALRMIRREKVKEFYTSKTINNISETHYR